MSETNPPGYKSGFVSILGRPNAGKSTLLNALVGQKVSIVADKPQTTRTTIQGVVTLPEGQIVFIDTPGIHDSSAMINRRMMDSVRDALGGRDLLLYLHDATEPVGEKDRHAIDMVRKTGLPAIAVVTKIDLVSDKNQLLPVLTGLQTAHEFVEYFSIAAPRNDGLDELRAAVLARLPEGPQYFPADHITDAPERFLACELIREQAIRETRQEVPHSITVVIDKWDEDERITKIYASIYVEKDGQKGILIGAKGSMLKKIGTAARGEMESLFDRRVHLELHVKVHDKWREKPMFLSSIDWRTMAGSDEK